MTHHFYIWLFLRHLSASLSELTYTVDGNHKRVASLCGCMGYVPAIKQPFALPFAALSSRISCLLNYYLFINPRRHVCKWVGWSVDAIGSRTQLIRLRVQHFDHYSILLHALTHCQCKTLHVYTCDAIATLLIVLACIWLRRRMSRSQRLQIICICKTMPFSQNKLGYVNSICWHLRCLWILSHCRLSELSASNPTFGGLSC